MFNYIVKKIKRIKGVSRAVSIIETRKKQIHQSELESLIKTKVKSRDSFALDLGSGPEPRNPFQAKNLYGVDIRENNINNIYFCDLSSDNLPFSEGMFDFVTAYDVLEHVPRVVNNNGVTMYPFVTLMNEIFRVLKNGGAFLNVTPCFPEKGAFQDPTHVNIMTEDTIELYFCEKSWARIYGFNGVFKLEDDGWVDGKYYSIIRKIASSPIEDVNSVQE